MRQDGLRIVYQIHPHQLAGHVPWVCEWFAIFWPSSSLRPERERTFYSWSLLQKSTRLHKSFQFFNLHYFLFFRSKILSKSYFKEDQIHFSSSNGLIILILIHFQLLSKLFKRFNWLVNFGGIKFCIIIFFSCTIEKSLLVAHRVTLLI